MRIYIYVLWVLILHSIIGVLMSCSSVSRSVFGCGKYTTELKSVEPAQTVCSSFTKSCTRSHDSCLQPPKPVLIGMPCEAGEFPVLVLLHGFLLPNSFYSQLIRHIASHGFIIVAPQLYVIAGPDTSEDIKSAAATTEWLPKGLHHFLPPHVRPNLTKLGLAGHSRGGKTAFSLALTSQLTSLTFSSLIGIDPVDGMDKGKQTHPHVLTYAPHSFELGMRVMVIGSGLGEVKRNPLFPPCAPKGVNHEDFFRECRAPACHFVVKDYGHLDMLDDDTKGVRGKATYCLCKNGESREPMRRFVGGAVVAFLEACFGGDGRELVDIRNGCGDMPVQLQKIEFLD